MQSNLRGLKEIKTLYNGFRRLPASVITLPPPSAPKQTVYKRMDSTQIKQKPDNYYILRYVRNYIAVL